MSSDCANHGAKRQRSPLSQASSVNSAVEGGGSRPNGEVQAEEGTRLCVTCGAVITEGTTRMHNEWHKQLDAAIAANRPDPRSAFIGG